MDTAIPDGYEPAGAPGRPADNVRPFPSAKRTVRLVSAADYADKPVPTRRFHVAPLVPCQTVTTLGGDGGTGKSLLALQLAVATTAGTKWCGLPVTPGAVLYLSAEDDEDELHRRLDDIALAESVSLDRLKQLRIVPLAGEDAMLAAPDPRSNILRATPLFNAVQELIETHAPSLLILDTLADLFGGSEIERAQARQFIGLLRGWAIKHDLAVLLLAHPSLEGMRSGTGSSGSTAWNNSVRSRLYLDRVKGDDGFEADPNQRLLRTVKANYGPIGSEIRLRWQDGVFVPVGQPEGSAFGAIAHQARAEQVFLELLARFGSEGRHVSATPSANFAPAVFASDAGAGGITKRGFSDAMSRLFATQRIKVVEVGPPSRRLKKIVAVEAAE